MGEATVEKVAINAVMAGCKPEHLPVVIAAVSAVCDPRMDSSEFQVTTHQVAPLIIVNGPAIQEAGVASGFGALGYGHRANLCIGRALRLCLINLGGVWPGESAMSLLSQPASIAYCLAEDEAGSPFPPLHTTLGFEAGQSAVTVACVGSPISVILPPSSDDAPVADRMLGVLAETIAGVGHNNASFHSGSIVVVLNPDHAQALAREGYDRERIGAELFERAVNTAERVSRARSGKPSPEPERIVPAIGAPDRAADHGGGRHRGLFHGDDIMGRRAAQQLARQPRDRVQRRLRGGDRRIGFKSCLPCWNLQAGTARRDHLNAQRPWRQSPPGPRLLAASGTAPRCIRGLSRAG